MPEPKNEEPKKPRRRVKKVAGHGGHHGGAWKVAYADFVTAMMALFLVLWLVSQADTKLKQAIASYFRSPGAFNTMQGGILSQAKKVSKEPTSLTSKDDEQVLFSVAQSLQKQFSTRPEFSSAKDRVKIDITEEGLRIQLIDKADKVSFQSGRAEVSDDAKAVLVEIASGLCALPNKINIGGHTDKYVFPSATGYTNWELSTDRANAARRVLESSCVKPEQINRIVGYADTEPLIPDDPYAPGNRRISIMVLRLANTPEVEGKESTNKETSENGNITPKVVETSKTESDKTESGKVEVKTEKLPETKLSPVLEKTAPKTSEHPTEGDSSEKQKAKAQLLKEGSITVGEPDRIPSKPVVKETIAKPKEH